MSHHSTSQVNPALDALFEAIAREHLFVETLQTRDWDRLDFHEVAVWGIRSALQAAYEAGQNASQRAAKSTRSPTAKPRRARTAGPASATPVDSAAAVL